MNLWTKTHILLIVTNFFGCLVFQSPEQSTDDMYICNDTTKEDLGMKFVMCQMNKWNYHFHSENLTTKKCCHEMDTICVYFSIIIEKCKMNESFNEGIQKVNESIWNNCSNVGIVPNEELCRPLIVCSQYNYDNCYHNSDAPNQCFPTVAVDPIDSTLSPTGGQPHKPDGISNTGDTTTHSDETTDAYITPNSFRALSLEIVTILTAIIAILSYYL